MAYIAPNSTVKLLHGVPLEPDYEHTLYTANIGAQSGAIGAYTKYTINPQTYQRVNSNSIRVGIVADNLYDCNYMMFQNTNFSTKWFYAFITSVNYVNNECTEITYQIDVMQTYFHNFTLGNCFVECEHSVVDHLGENFIDEGLEIGDYFFEGYSSEANFRDIGVFCIDSTDVQGGKIIDETFQGGRVYCFKPGEESDLISFLAQHTSTPENITAIWSAPCYLVTTNAQHAVVGYSASEFVKSYTALSGTETFGSYTPKNKKLYMYPYNFFHVDNGMGQNLQIHYEYCNNFTPTMSYMHSITNPVEMLARPCAYKGTRAGGGLATWQELNTESLKISGYGVGSWANNTWAQLVGANIFNGVTGALGNALRPGMRAGYDINNRAGLASPKNDYISGVGESVLDGYGGVMKSVMSKGLTPQVVYGSGNSGCALAAHRELNFYTGRCRITEEYAKTIDDFFSVYGYKTNRVKLPNTHSRPHWNYVKTCNCELTASETMPADDAALVKNIFNKGVTFWKNLSEVGNYTLDNSP